MDSRAERSLDAQPAACAQQEEIGPGIRHSCSGGPTMFPAAGATQHASHTSAVKLRIATGSLHVHAWCPAQSSRACVQVSLSWGRRGSAVPAVAKPPQQGLCLLKVRYIDVHELLLSHLDAPARFVPAAKDMYRVTTQWLDVMACILPAGA
jgi:hypothetical protein